ncbi:hypothetical protein EUX98_g3841 [Antrodiella citrinella]|uniref:Uncharacterized protein n=1 Tax=Antrodiella citrinella TaxID=2447956 RepID=A0A4S4MVK6_9APHY|nr:hypothetical protein EUX98_g3841 [Antrodiella citrinella]
MSLCFLLASGMVAPPDLMSFGNGPGPGFTDVTYDAWQNAPVWPSTEPCAGQGSTDDLNGNGGGSTHVYAGQDDRASKKKKDNDSGDYVDDGKSSSTEEEEEDDDDDDVGRRTRSRVKKRNDKTGTKPKTKKAGSTKHKATNKAPKTKAFPKPVNDISYTHDVSMSRSVFGVLEERARSADTSLLSHQKLIRRQRSVSDAIMLDEQEIALYEQQAFTLHVGSWGIVEKYVSDTRGDESAVLPAALKEPPPLAGFPSAPSAFDVNGSVPSPVDELNLQDRLREDYAVEPFEYRFLDFPDPPKPRWINGTLCKAATVPALVTMAEDTDGVLERDASIPLHKIIEMESLRVECEYQARKQAHTACLGMLEDIQAYSSRRRVHYLVVLRKQEAYRTHLNSLQFVSNHMRSAPVVGRPPWRATVRPPPIRGCAFVLPEVPAPLPFNYQPFLLDALGPATTTVSTMVTDVRMLDADASPDSHNWSRLPAAGPST